MLLAIVQNKQHSWVVHFTDQQFNDIKNIETALNKHRQIPTFNLIYVKNTMQPVEVVYYVCINTNKSMYV